MGGKFEGHKSEYKFRGLTSEELRRRREETSVKLRQKAREDSLNKRRNVDENQPPVSESASVTSHFPFSNKDNLFSMREGINSYDYKTILDNLILFRKMLSKEENPPIQDVIDLGVIPRFIELLEGKIEGPTDAVEKLIFESAWSLTNIASGQHAHTLCVVELGAASIFIKLMSHTNNDIKEQSIWALGNIAGDSPSLRNFVLDLNVMPPLLTILEEEMSSISPNISLIRNSTWTLSNLCRGKPPPDFQFIAPCINTLFKLLSCNDFETLSDASWAVSYISDDSENFVGLLISSGIIQLLSNNLTLRNDTIQTPCLRAIGNIVSGNEAQTQAVIDCGVLSKFQDLLRHYKSSIQKECCWAISNITAGNVYQVQAVIDSNLFPSIIILLRSGDTKTKKEAIWAICNATSHHSSNPEQVKYLISQGCLKPLCEMLSGQDTKIIQVILDGIDNILSVGKEELLSGLTAENTYATNLEEMGTLDIICNLQKHPNDNVYMKAKGIIDKYYSQGNEIMDDNQEDFSFDHSILSRPEQGFSF
jgi:importin subunit alpha-6/7